MFDEENTEKKTLQKNIINFYVIAVPTGCVSQMEYIHVEGKVEKLNDK